MLQKMLSDCFMRTISQAIAKRAVNVIRRLLSVSFAMPENALTTVENSITVKYGKNLYFHTIPLTILRLSYPSRVTGFNPYTLVQNQYFITLSQQCWARQRASRSMAVSLFISMYFEDWEMKVLVSYLTLWLGRKSREDQEWSVDVWSWGQGLRRIELERLCRFQRASRFQYVCYFKRLCARVLSSSAMPSIIINNTQIIKTMYKHPTRTDSPPSLLQDLADPLINYNKFDGTLCAIGKVDGQKGAWMMRLWRVDGGEKVQEFGLRGLGFGRMYGGVVGVQGVDVGVWAVWVIGKKKLETGSPQQQILLLQTHNSNLTILHTSKISAPQLATHPILQPTFFLTHKTLTYLPQLHCLALSWSYCNKQGDPPQQINLNNMQALLNAMPKWVVRVVYLEIGVGVGVGQKMEEEGEEKQQGNQLQVRSQHSFYFCQRRPHKNFTILHPLSLSLSPQPQPSLSLSPQPQPSLSLEPKPRTSPYLLFYQTTAIVPGHLIQFVDRRLQFWLAPMLKDQPTSASRNVEVLGYSLGLDSGVQEEEDTDDVNQIVASIFEERGEHSGKEAWLVIQTRHNSTAKTLRVVLNLETATAKVVSITQQPIHSLDSILKVGQAGPYLWYWVDQREAGREGVYVFSLEKQDNGNGNGNGEDQRYKLVHRVEIGRGFGPVVGCDGQGRLRIACMDEKERLGVIELSSKKLLYMKLLQALYPCPTMMEEQSYGEGKQEVHKIEYFVQALAKYTLDLL